MLRKRSSQRLHLHRSCLLVAVGYYYFERALGNGMRSRYNENEGGGLIGISVVRHDRLMNKDEICKVWQGLLQLSKF